MLKVAISTPLKRFSIAVNSLVVMASRPSSDLSAFREEFHKAKSIVVLTGAGISAESGVPTFRGAGGYWRRWQAQDLASPSAFARDPSLVWEFYHYRREVMATKNPNPAHYAVAECEKKLKEDGRHVVVITQNIDELHRRAGSENILELHGSLFRVRCTTCSKIERNTDSPICEALRGHGAPDPDARNASIPIEDLPRCKSCGSLARPDVVWFGEGLDPTVLDKTMEELEKCDLCLIIGTSSVVYPAAMFAPQLASRGVTVAEFNLEDTPATNLFRYHFSGPAGEWVPKALAPPSNDDK